MASHEKILTNNLEVWSSSTKAKANSGRAGNKKLELYGLKKLRELILQLAVLGKLIPRESKWNAAKFEEIFDFQGGGQPPKSQFISEPRDGYIRLFQIRDLGENPMPTYIPKEGVRNFCDENDILIGRYGASVGKIFKGKKGTYNVALVKLIWSAESFDQEFLMTWLKGKAFQNRLTGISRSAQAGFNKRDLASIEIQYPNLPEQKRIIEKLKELMTLCDKLELEQESNLKTHEAMLSTLLNGLTSNLADAFQFEECWKLIQDNFNILFTTERSIEQLKQTIIQLAVMGKLVSQNPEDEPANELLKKIDNAKAKCIKEKKIKKQKPLPKISKKKEPYSLPDNWEWIRLGDATNYGITQKIEASEVEKEMWVLELEDIEKITSRLLKKVRFNERRFKSSKNIFNKSDVIYGKLRPYLDKVIIADEPGVCTTEMIPLRGYAGILSEYLRWVMKSPYFKEYANDSTHGMNLPRMGTEKARLALIPLPPKEEQHRIVAKVNELMILCDQLKLSLALAQTTQLKLAESVLEKAIG